MSGGAIPRKCEQPRARDHPERDEHKRTRMRPRAWLTYEQTVRLHLVPGLGKLALGRLKSTNIERWFDEHQKAGTGTRTIRRPDSAAGGAQPSAEMGASVGERGGTRRASPAHS